MRCALLLCFLSLRSASPLYRSPVIFSVFSHSLTLLSRLLREDREKRRDEMQDTRTGAFKAVTIFGYYFAVRAKGADKTVTRQAGTERTARRQMFLNPYFSSLLPLLWNSAVPYCM